MKKKILTVVLAMTMVAGTLAGCGSREVEDFATKEGQPYEESVEVPDISEPVDVNGDGTDWESFQEDIEAREDHNYKHIMNMIDSLYASNKKNTILSETSLDMALGMVMQGASDNAATEFNTYYNMTAKDKLNRDHSLIGLYNSRDDVTLKIANSMYVNEGVDINDEFKSNVIDGYYASVDNMDFTDAGSADVINKWCSDNTNGMIDQITTPDALRGLDAAILNALYFNGKWEDKFEDYQLKDKDFTNVGNGVSTITGMYESGLDTYYETETATGFAKYYKGGEIAFIGILPDEGILDKNEDFLMSDIDLAEFLESETYDYYVNIMMPKFKVEDSNSLTEVIESEGLVSMFETGNLDGINSDMRVSSVIQKTVVDVTEEGTEAAAVTMIGMELTCANPMEVQVVDVILDRPFAFMIYDTVNDEILFIGKIVEL